MNKIGRNNTFFLLGVGSLLFACLFFLYKEDIEKVTLILIGLFTLIASPFLFNRTSNLLLVIVFLTPLSVDLTIGGGFKLSAPSEILMLLVVGVVFIKYLGGMKVDKKILTHPMSVIVLMLIGSLIFSTITSVDTSVSIKRTISQSLFYIVFYYFFLSFLKNNDQLKKIYWLYGLGFIIPIIYTIIDHSKWGFIQPASVYASLPFYDEHTIYGACLAFLVPFFILNMTTKNKTKSIFFLKLFILSLVLVALFLSYSRAAWISVLVALLFYGLVKIKLKFHHFVTLLLIIGGVLYFNFNTIYEPLKENSLKYGDNFSTHIVSITNLQNDASNMERINRWVCAVRMFDEKPVLGFGPGTYQFYYGKYQTNEFTTRISTHMGDKGNAHSEYFTYLSETGIVGFLIFLLLIFYSIYLSLKLIYSNCDKSSKLLVYAAVLGLITFYTHGLFNSFSDSQKMGILFISSLAVLVRIDLNQTSKIKS